MRTQNFTLSPASAQPPTLARTAPPLAGEGGGEELASTPLRAKPRQSAPCHATQTEMRKTNPRAPAKLARCRE